MGNILLIGAAHALSLVSFHSVALATPTSLQAVVYISVCSEKEGLTHQVMVTELFGPVEEDGKTSYVAANTADETPAATTQEPTPVDPSKEGSVV